MRIDMRYKRALHLATACFACAMALVGCTSPEGGTFVTADLSKDLSTDINKVEK
ncbi:MAG: hypothetical protein ACE15C_04155 [Phycisphaerae bacterium]